MAIGSRSRKKCSKSGTDERRPQLPFLDFIDDQAATETSQAQESPLPRAALEPAAPLPNAAPSETADEIATAPGEFATVETVGTSPAGPECESTEETPVNDVLADAKVRFGLNARAVQVLRAILAMDDAERTRDHVAWLGSQKELAKAANVARNTVRRAITEDLKPKGLLTTRARVQGGDIHEYLVRLDVIEGRVSTFGDSVQLQLKTGRAHAADLGAPTSEGGRAHAADVGAPRADSLAPAGNAGGRAHAHELNEVNESKNHSLNSDEHGRAHAVGPWSWTPQQLADPGYVDATIIPAAITRFGLVAADATRQGIAAAACCACSRGSNAPGLFTHFIETRAWERSRSRHPGDTWIAEKWFSKAQAIRKQQHSEADPDSPVQAALATEFSRRVLEAELDALSDDVITTLAANGLRRHPAAQHAWRMLSMHDRRQHDLIRPLLLQQLEAERATVEVSR